MNKLLVVLIASVFTATATLSLATDNAAASTPVSKTVKVEQHTKKRVKVEKKGTGVAHKTQIKKVEEQASAVATND